MIATIRRLFGRRNRAEEYVPTAVRRAQHIRTHAATLVAANSLSKREATAAESTAKELLSESLVVLGWPDDLDDALLRLWTEGIEGPTRLLDERKKNFAEDFANKDLHVTPSFPEYYFSMSLQFLRSLCNIKDERLQGRVLEAITTIAQHPMPTIGFTILPLGGCTGGLWRYFVDGHRLIYAPDTHAPCATLISFERTNGHVTRP
ncbi:MAG TPA: hypothetical protein VE029_01410 [Rhizobacter sp.]|nr:hypothetical protein [Rhizobacter sp.]